MTQAPTSGDALGIALAGIGSGATTGAACITAGALVLRLLQVGGRAGDERVAFSIIAGSAIAGLVFASTVGWLSTRAITNTWRRGVAAALSGFGAVLLALLATPADTVAGVLGVTLYLAVLIAGLVWFRRAARRAGAA